MAKIELNFAQRIWVRQKFVVGLDAYRAVLAPGVSVTPAEAITGLLGPLLNEAPEEYASQIGDTERELASNIVSSGINGDLASDKIAQILIENLTC